MSSYGQSIIDSLGLRPAVESKRRESEQLRDIMIQSGQQQAQATLDAARTRAQGLSSLMQSGQSILQSIQNKEQQIAQNKIEADKFNLEKQKFGLDVMKEIGDIDIERQKLDLQRKELLQKKDLTEKELKQQLDLKAKENELAERKMELELAKIDATGNKDKNAQEDVIRKELNPVINKFSEIESSHEKILTSLNQDSAAGDLAAIFSFMKVLDPTSAVRETEFANAQNAAGIPSRIRNLWNKALSGKRLDPKQMQDFKETANTLFESEKKSFEKQYGRALKISENRGLNFENISGGFVPKSVEPSKKTLIQRNNDEIKTDESGGRWFFGVKLPK